MVGSRLWRAGLRHQRLHGWQTVLAILGIALGVAVVMAVGLANQSASRAFEITMQQVSGRVTHQILAGPAGLPEQLYTDLRLQHPELTTAPVVEGVVRIRNEQFTLLGLDPLSEQPFRSLTALPAPDILTRLLTQENALLLSTYTAKRLGLESGNQITLDVAGVPRQAQIIALFGDQQGAALDGVLVADIAAAQTLLGQFGTLDRIDLTLRQEQIRPLQEWLPKGLHL
ncbi:MAG: ABC transporter permease, partial [Sedimenticola sp.]|nr:ABC transporter permease [Sedimenticola sp.]